METKNGEKPKIAPGYTVGSLTVLEGTQQRKSGYMVWKCGCTCGGEILLDTRALQRGTIRDCGCQTKLSPGQQDLTGRRFGRLICIEPTTQRSSRGGLVWRCRCDCGAECLAVGRQLVAGYKKSCGCLSHPTRKDFVGKRFGQLTVTGYAGKQSGMHRWNCLCDCGRHIVVGQTLLQSGKTKSCGCLQAGMAEKNMKFIDGTSVTILEKTGEKLVSSNTSGYNGVYFSKRSKKWTAQIGFKGKNHHLGYFTNIQDAVKARRNAEDRIYGAFIKWYYDTHPDQKKPDGKK